MVSANIQKTMGVARSGYGKMLVKDLMRNKYVYLMALPVILYYIIFCYIPMYGLVIGFKEFNIAKGIIGSSWVGLEHFIRFFNSHFFIRVTRNTFLVSFYMLVFGFPAPIILALMLNEIRQNSIKRFIQTSSYLPHFISIMVLSGIIIQFTGEHGLVNDILKLLGFQRSTLLLKPELFRPIYVSTGIWQEIGWGSIIYLSALSSIDHEQYEASRIDGAGKWKQMIHVTIPGIMPTVVIMLIMRIGQMMNIGFEKILLLYNSNTYETADVISTYVYRVGLQNMSYDYSTAVGLFNSIINFILLISANYISRKVNETSLW